MTKTFVNFRDVGGLPLREGGRTRSGVLLRSSAPMPEDALPVGLSASSFTVVDLRSAEEQPQYRWPTGASVVQHNLFAPGDLTRLRDVDLVLLYQDMLVAAAERIVAVAGMVSEEGPTLVHCTAGKDRTGVVVAILLLLAGVERQAIVADYHRTEAEMPAVIERLSAIGAVDLTNVSPPWFTAPTSAIDAVIDAVTQHPGGPLGWFTDHGGDFEAMQRLTERLRQSA